MPPARNLSPWAQWMLRLERTTTADPCPVDDPAAIPAWRERARSRLLELLGPDPRSVPPRNGTVRPFQRTCPRTFSTTDAATNPTNTTARTG